MPFSLFSLLLAMQKKDYVSNLVTEAQGSCCTKHCIPRGELQGQCAQKVLSIVGALDYHGPLFLHFKAGANITSFYSRKMIYTHQIVFLLLDRAFHIQKQKQTPGEMHPKSLIVQQIPLTLLDSGTPLVCQDTTAKHQTGICQELGQVLSQTSDTHSTGIIHSLTAGMKIFSCVLFLFSWIPPNNSN